MTASFPIDMSLRLWSHEVPLDHLGDRLGLAVQVRHVAGRQVPTKNSTTRRSAKTHFAAIGQRSGSSAADVDTWLRDILDRVGADIDLVEELRRNVIDAVLWIAVLGAVVGPSVSVTDSSVAAAGDLAMRIFVEDFTTLRNGNPSTVWLPTSSERALA